MEPGGGFHIGIFFQGNQDQHSQHKSSDAQDHAAHGNFGHLASANNPTNAHQQIHDDSPCHPAELVFSVVAGHPLNIPADDHGQGRQQHQHVGNLFRFGDGKENEDKNPPHLQEQQFRALFPHASGKGVLDRFQQQTGPGEQPQNNDGKVEPPVYPFGMQRCGKAADVMEADKLINKIHAVILEHEDVPGHPYCCYQNQTGNYVHVQQPSQIAGKQQVQKNDRAGEHHPDRPFRHYRKAAEQIHQPVFFMHKTKQRTCHKEQQGRVCYGSLAHIHDHDSSSHHQAGPEPGPGIKLTGSGKRCH